MNFPKRNRRPSVVDQVGAQTDQARSLSQITDQQLLADPRTNPATRGHADRLRDDQQRHALTLEHRRELRKGRVSDRRAAHAERTLDAIQAARETASPALSVVALHTGRRRYMSTALVASLALSVGSALGVEAAAQAWGAPVGVGYLAEVGLTGLATAVILYRSHLAQHTHRADTHMPLWQERVLWVLMLVPLVGSIVASTAGSGPVGALCSIGAAAFALLAYLIADRSSALMRATAALVDTADEAELRRQAAGEELFSAVVVQEDTEEPGSEPEEVDEGAAAVAAIEEWLGERSRVGHDVADRHQEATQPPVNGSHRINGAARHFVPDQGNDGTFHTVAPRNGGGVVDVADDGGESSEQVVDAVHANRLKGAHTRLRVAEHLAVNPTHNARQVGEALSISESTARRYMKELVEEGEE